MSAHTPGPWSLATVKTSCGFCHQIGPFPWKEGEGSHACIYVDYPNHDNRGKFEDELTANARLIAAAPELLSALQDVLRIAKAASIGVTGNQPRIARAEAAIAKAVQP